MSEILLVSMPYGALERPALGLSLLKATLIREGIDCEVRYPYFDFAEMIGENVYRWVSSVLPHTALAGEFTFTDVLYGPRPRTTQAYHDDVLRKRFQRTDQDIALLTHVRRAANQFIKRCLDEIDWASYRIVGFTSTFEQNIASLALGRVLKKCWPHLQLVYGGANWEGVMGLELHRRFGFVDYVCSGEADHSFPALVQKLLAGEETSVATIPGLIYRKDGETCSTGSPKRVFEMDSLPIPDFTEFFDRFAEGGTRTYSPLLLMESSRGCWWGARSHCTFCGLNGDGMAFRSKSADRFLSELETLVARWPTDIVEMVDNILDVKYFREVIPRLAAREERLELFYEVKANLSRKQVEQLFRAGVTRIQPGIESLNDHVLELMRKGITALQNIQMLKWCAAFGIDVSWNVLIGFPGETLEDYEDMFALMKPIRFLQPPGSCATVRLDRFSPYFDDPDAFGIERIRPIEPYPYLYPFNEESLSRIAYFFRYTYPGRDDLASSMTEMARFVQHWTQDEARGSLVQSEAASGTLLVRDTRDGRDVTHTLADLERDIYLYCDENHTLKAICRHLRVPDDQAIRPILDRLVAEELMVTRGDRYLSLAVSSADQAIAAELTEAITA